MSKKENTQKVEPQKKDFFELIVNNPNQASPFLQFSWCVNKKGIEYMREKQVLHAFLLVVILNKKAYDDDWEDYNRQLYPLDRGLGHIEFSRPGEYRIHASVIWTRESEDGNHQKATEARKKLYDHYIKISHGGYENIVHDDVGYRPEYLVHSKLPYHDVIKVKIDNNLFAPEPSQQLKWWVNMLWGWNKPKNQCEWRRRKIFAFTIQPFLVALFLVFRSVCAVVKALFPLFIGFYPNKIGWKAIFHPFDMDLSDIVDRYELLDGDNYWWIAIPDSEKHSRLEMILMSPITAYGIAILFSIAVVFNIFHMATLFDHLEWNIQFTSLLLAIVVMSAALLLCKVFMYVLDRFFGEKLEKRAQRRRIEKQDAETRRRKQEEVAYQSSLSFFYDQRLKPLACTERTREATLASLPQSHRTLELRFMDLKVKVCKPFRR